MGFRGKPLGRGVTQAILSGQATTSSAGVRHPSFRSSSLPTAVPGEIPTAPTGRLLVVGSGKGGTGKSFLAANLAVQWSLWGRRVVLVDADLGLANLHLLLGLQPETSLVNLLAPGKARNGHHKNLLVEGPAGVRLLAGATGVQRLAHLNRGELRRFMQRLKVSLGNADAVIIDLSSGISPSTLHFLEAAQEVIVVSNPDPSALLDAYAVIKVLHSAGHDGDIHLIMNRGRDALIRQNAARRLLGTVDRFLQHPVNLLGDIPEDEAAGEALRRRRPLQLSRPDAAAAVAIREVALRLNRGGERRATDTATSFFSRSADLLAPRRRTRPS